MAKNFLSWPNFDPKIKLLDQARQKFLELSEASASQSLDPRAEIDLIGSQPAFLQKHLAYKCISSDKSKKLIFRNEALIWLALSLTHSLNISLAN